MVQLKYVTLAACLWFQICMAMPLADEDRYYEKEISKDFAQWLTAALTSSGNSNDPCRYHFNNIEYYHQFPKRNSELINSLLSVPKTMNDAGK